MATMYLMSLEDRVDLARHQLDFVIMRLRSITGESRPEEIDHIVNLAVTHLSRIGEMIAR